MDINNPDEIDERMVALENVSRKLGLYLERAGLTQIEAPDGPQTVVIAEFTIGDVAFSKRVQNPEQDSIDKQFQEMTTDLATNDFLEIRERVKRNLLAGRDPLDDGC